MHARRARPALRSDDRAHRRQEHSYLNEDQKHDRVCSLCRIHEEPSTREAASKTLCHGASAKSFAPGGRAWRSEKRREGIAQGLAAVYQRAHERTASVINRMGLSGFLRVSLLDMRRRQYQLAVRQCRRCRSAALSNSNAPFAVSPTRVCPAPRHRRAERVLHTPGWSTS